MYLHVCYRELARLGHYVGWSLDAQRGTTLVGYAGFELLNDIIDLYRMGHLTTNHFNCQSDLRPFR